jgi:hypothetical protein
MDTYLPPLFTFPLEAEIAHNWLLRSTKGGEIKLSLHFLLSQRVEIPLTLASSSKCSCPCGSADRMRIIWRRISQNSFRTLNLTFILVLLSPPSRFFVARNLCKSSNQPCSPPTTENVGSNHKEQFCNLRAFLCYIGFGPCSKQGKPKVT